MLLKLNNEQTTFALLTELDVLSFSFLNEFSVSVREAKERYVEYKKEKKKSFYFKLCLLFSLFT